MKKLLLFLLHIIAILIPYNSYTKTYSYANNIVGNLSHLTSSFDSLPNELIVIIIDYMYKSCTTDNLSVKRKRTTFSEDLTTTLTTLHTLLSPLVRTSKRLGALVFQYLSKKKINYIHIATLFSDTPYGYKELKNYLENHKAEINLKSIQGYTPLMTAALHGKLAGAQLLIKAGARLATTNAKSYTALTYAILAKQASLKELFYKYGMKLSTYDIDLEDNLTSSNASGQNI